MCMQETHLSYMIAFPLAMNEHKKVGSKEEVLGTKKQTVRRSTNISIWISDFPT